jgi:hypothetical protein
LHPTTANDSATTAAIPTNERIKRDMRHSILVELTVPAWIPAPAGSDDWRPGFVRFDARPARR